MSVTELSHEPGQSGSGESVLSCSAVNIAIVNGRPMGLSLAFPRTEGIVSL